MSSNKKIIHALIVISALFLSLVIYLTYFQLFQADKLATSAENPRTVIKEQKIKRGTIYSSDGQRLAYSEMGENTQKRVYPFNNMYSHVIGYNNQTYGRSMLEYTYNGFIMGSAFSNEIYNLRQRIMGSDVQGADLTLTIDHGLQQKAYELLGNRKGSIVALDPKTGATLALVSKPDYNPNEDALKQNWQKILESEDSQLLARATLGLYPPGSVFKTITAVSAIENGLENETFDDKGSTIIGNYEFENYDGKAYGKLDLLRGYTKSSNVVFVTLADKLGYYKMRNTMDRFMIDKDIAYDLNLQKATGLLNDSVTNVAAVGMGQGDLSVTPMSMALVAAAIANDGIMMSPYLVERASLSNGYSVYQHANSVLSKVTDDTITSKIEEMMIEVIKSGTGTGARVSGITIAGKTGTAENSGKDHAWFIAYAPADDPEIAVSVIIENAGQTGGAACAPIISGLIRYWCK